MLVVEFSIKEKGIVRKYTVKVTNGHAYIYGYVIEIASVVPVSLGIIVAYAGIMPVLAGVVLARYARGMPTWGGMGKMGHS